jgi:serine/threonine-protein kinase mTOR
MPPFLNMMRGCPPNMLEFHFQQLGVLVSIIKQHIRNYLTDIFTLIQEFWSPVSNIQITILSLVEAIAIALDAEFKAYLPTLLPQMLQIFELDTTEKRLPTQKVLHAMTIFGSNLEEYLHLVISMIVKLYEKPDVPISLRKYAIQVTGVLCKKVNFTDQSSKIVHPLVRVLNSPNSVELRTVTMETLSALLYQMKSDFLIFIPMINKVYILIFFQ